MMKPSKNRPFMSNDSRIAVLETVIHQVNNSLLDIRQDIKQQSSKIDALEKKLDSKADNSTVEALSKKIDTKVDALDKKIDALEVKMDNRFDVFHKQAWSNFLWIMGMMVGLAGLIAHTQHWI